MTCPPRAIRPQIFRRAFAATTLALGSGTAQALDIGDRLALNGLLAGALQCQEVSVASDAPDACRGSGAFQPKILFRPTDADQFFIKLGFGAGNGLNQASPFSLRTWAADLEDDVRDINGRTRSYLLEAWYAHTFRLAQNSTLQLTAGIIDPAFYVNENAYANDEFTQFSNEIFVNSRNTFLPAYDAGGVIVWKIGNWTVSGVGMKVGENEDGNAYDWYAAEVDYHLTTGLGEGNYRMTVSATSDDFLDPMATRKTSLATLSLSFDQEFGPAVGAFLRFAWAREDALVDYRADYSPSLTAARTFWRLGA
jgi:porin